MRGFGFVCFKTEWDARKAIKILDGCLIGDKFFFVQMAKFVNRNNTGNNVTNNRAGERLMDVLGLSKGSLVPLVAASSGSRFARKEVWHEKEGSLHVVKVDEFVSSVLKRAVSYTFVAVGARMCVREEEIEGQLVEKVGANAQVKRLIFS